MYKCRVCGAQTHVEHGLCKKCWIEWKKNEHQKNGLNQKEYEYHFNMIKGRIAETLIQELFISSGLDVFHYGMENTIPGIMELLYGIKTEVAQDIRRMPDFVVHNPITNSFYFLEVKYRASGSFSFDDVDADYPYHNAYFVIVSKKSITCITYQELKNGKVIGQGSEYDIDKRKEFILRKDVVTHYCGFAEKFFAGV